MCRWGWQIWLACVVEAKFLSIFHICQAQPRMFLSLQKVSGNKSGKKYPWLCLTKWEIKRYFDSSTKKVKFDLPIYTSFSYISSLFFWSVELFSLLKHHPLPNVVEILLRPDVSTYMVRPILLLMRYSIPIIYSR